MISRIEAKDLSKIAFGDQKTFDLAFLAEAEEEDEQEVHISNEKQIPKDQKKRQLFLKSLVGADAILKKKVNNRKSDLRKQVEDEVRANDLRTLDTTMRELRLDVPIVDPIERIVTPHTENVSSYSSLRLQATGSKKELKVQASLTLNFLITGFDKRMFRCYD